MLAYLLLAKPFDGIINNVINIYNEILVLVCFLSVLTMNVISFSDTVTSIWGWILIGLILLSLCSIWIVTIPTMYAQAMNFFRAPDNENTKESSNITERYRRYNKSLNDVDAVTQLGNSYKRGINKHRSVRNEGRARDIFN